MSTTANPMNTPSAPAPSRACSSAHTNQAHPDPSCVSGHIHHHHHEPPPATQQPPAPPTNGKKGKKKAADPHEASKLIAAKISQLELETAGEKDQEAEIEREIKKANRELNNNISKLDDFQKIDVLQRRVTEHLADMKRLERDNQKNKKRGDMLQKEKDHSRTELSKSITLREKLEKLCRELQRENNRLKGENKTLHDAAKKDHADWDQKWEQMLWEFQDYQEEKDHPQAHVVSMEIEELFRQRFRSLIDQYELRELHFHSLLRTKELEVQYNLARYDQQRKQAETETSKAKSLNNQVLTFSKTETELRNQLNIYVEKFKQVEDTLNNSNDLFLTFRKEMEEMSKKTKRLEKENLNISRKHDSTNRNILEMAEERTKSNQEYETLKKRNEKLNAIINQMQQQGRGLAPGMAGVVESEYAEGDLGTESEYEYEDEEGDEEPSEAEYDEDTEEEVHSKLFGPEKPPSVVATNGMTAANGVKH